LANGGKGGLMLNVVKSAIGGKEKLWSGLGSLFIGTVASVILISTVIISGAVLGVLTFIERR
jgi:hypothetical protein